MQFKPADFQTFEAYKKVIRSAASQVKNDTPFCLFSDVEIPDSSKKLHTLRPFFVVGGAQAAVVPLLKDLKGGKKPLAHGVCSLENGKISFEAQNGKLDYNQLKSQASALKELFGKEILFPSASPAAKPPEAKPDPAAEQKAAQQPARLNEAATHWHGVRTMADNKLKELKQAVRQHYDGAHPELLKEIDRNMVKIDAVLDKFDHKLTDALKASAAANPSARESEMRKAHAILSEYKRIVESEKLIAHVDRNPFGVKTNLKQLIVESLTKAEKSMA